MKVVIPMAGKGVRFAKAGFKEPKPLIEVAGKPMFCWPVESIKKMTAVRDRDFIFIVRREHADAYQIDKKIKSLFPGSRVIIGDDFQGAAQTVYLAKSFLDPGEELIQTDCDQYFILSGFERARNTALANDYGGIIGTLDSQNPGYSYVELDDRGFVKKTAEKELISKHASIGAYYFTKSKYFINAVEQMMAQGQKTKGEYYTCPVYNFIIPHKKITIAEADFWMTMGTPQEKTIFEKYINQLPKA